MEILRGEIETAMYVLNLNQRIGDAFFVSCSITGQVSQCYTGNDGCCHDRVQHCYSFSIFVEPE